MKKLEDIPKKEIFNVPDNYFEKLPEVIQTRIAKEQPASRSIFFRYRLQYAVAACVVLLVASVFWFREPASNVSAESIIASIDTEDLISYLQESDISTEEIIEHVGFNTSDIENIEVEAYKLHLDEFFVDDLDELNTDTL